MYKFFILLGLIGFASAECPRIGPEEFRDILNNNEHKLVLDGIKYHIKDRKRVKHGIESAKQPRVIIKDHKGDGSHCKYTRKIGKKWFGSFFLKEDHKKYKKHRHKKVVVVD